MVLSLRVLMQAADDMFWRNSIVPSRQSYKIKPEFQIPFCRKFCNILEFRLAERSVWVLEINLLKPSGFFTYHKFQHSKILHGARFALSVLYGYQNSQRLLLYTALTDWFL